MSFSLFSYPLKREDVKAGFVISVWESKRINYVIEVIFIGAPCAAGGALPPPVQRHRGAGGGGGGVPPDQDVDTGVGTHLRQIQM